MKDLIRRTLEHCGYDQCDPTEQELVSCFLDYVDGGCFRELTVEDAKEMLREGEITIEQICRNLMKRVG